MRYKILICDDNDFDVYILLASLNIIGLSIEVLRARDGVEALNCLSRDSELDLVILDHWLPKKSGLDVIHELRRCGGFPQCPVVVLTSSLGKEHEALRNLGVHAILEKPLNLDGYRRVGESLAKLCH